MCEYFISETDVAQNMIIDLRGLFLENRSTSLLLIFDCALNLFLSLLKITNTVIVLCLFFFFPFYTTDFEQPVSPRSYCITHYYGYVFSFYLF